MKKVSKEPLISVIVPVYKVEEYLDKCVDSIINQTYKNLEIILVDDGSPDNCPKMCDDYAKKDKRIKVIHKKNGGVSSARNEGIKFSKGDYISFIDSDDWIDNNYIEEMYNALTYNEADYVCCGYKRVCGNNLEYIHNDEKIIIYNNAELLLKLLNVQNGYGFCHMKLISKKVIKNVVFNEKLVVGEDALFNIELCKNINKAVILNKSLYNYFFNSNSVVRKYDEKYVDKYLNSMKYMSEYIEKSYNNMETKDNLYNYIAYHVMLICVNYCYHPKNNNKYKSLKKVCNIELFKNAIKKSNYNELSLTRKVTLFTLKFKLYFLTAIICKIRQYQFR
jgi:glycosyltransferase involved in cell wall biosynthesis